MDNPVFNGVYFSSRLLSLVLFSTMRLSLTLLMFLFLQNVVRSSAVQNHPAETLDKKLKGSREVRVARNLEGVVETSDVERQALVDLYYSTNGEGWTESGNWLDGDPCLNQWHGVTCDDDTEG